MVEREEEGQQLQQGMGAEALETRPSEGGDMELAPELEAEALIPESTAEVEAVGSEGMSADTPLEGEAQPVEPDSPPIAEEPQTSFEQATSQPAASDAPPEQISVETYDLDVLDEPIEVLEEPEAGGDDGPVKAEAEAAEIAEVTYVEPDDGRQWYVVHCYSGYENKVRHNLEQRIDTMNMKDKIFDVVVPTEEEMEVREGKRRTVERRVFPGYILVQMIMNEDSWYVVRNTPGVTGFVGMGNEPTPLRPEEVSQIIRRMEAEAPRIKVNYKTGQKVRIIDGPFNDFIGTVDNIDVDRAKVRVMVSFFGRDTPVELDFLQVEKA